jgi:GntR family transcriptional regulator, transcriptional repressor for pyruvate dehydrogenase complex
VRASNKGVIPVQRTTLTAAAFDQLISHVVNGNWKAGDRIPPERDLCQQLGIARTSLREALKAMELVGMVDSRVGDGTFVCPRSEFLSRPLLWAFTGTDDTEFQEIMEARIIIEENLAGLAAQRANEREVKLIGEAVQLMQDSIARGEPILEADMAFHLAIAHASHNHVLAKAVQLLRNLMRQWLFYKVLIPDVAPRILKRHLAVYRAIAQHKPVAARREMRLHLDEAMVIVAAVIKERKSR